MRYPDNPPHDRPGQNDVGDRPVTGTTTSEARGTSGTPTTSEAPATCGSDNLGSSGHLGTNNLGGSGHFCGSGNFCGSYRDRNRRHRRGQRPPRRRGSPERGLRRNEVRQLLLRLAHGRRHRRTAWRDRDRRRYSTRNDPKR